MLFLLIIIVIIISNITLYVLKFPVMEFKTSRNFFCLLIQYKQKSFLPPSPYSFCKESPRKSTLEIDLAGILLEINNIIPQYTHFIELFKSTIVQTDANVIIDTGGSMSIDVPASMSDDKAVELSKRLNVIDSLIRSRSDEIEKLLQEGNRIESELSKNNAQYKLQILDKVREFEKLKNSYKD